MKQFNPEEANYGAWMEQRRQAFLQATVRNSYFHYSASVTAALVIVGMLYGKKLMDYRRMLWVTAEMMADLSNQDAYSRRVAREAIHKYNLHIERCNRAIEATEHGTSPSEMQIELERVRGELRSVADERDGYKRERDLAKSELTEKERILANLSLRLDALSRKSETHRSSASPSSPAFAPPSSPSVGDAAGSADPKLVQHINNLQEQLYIERKENRRLKGA